MRKPMLCRGLASHYRLTTAAADKASVFTEFMAVAEEEEEAAGRRRRKAKGERCESQLRLLEELNDLRKWNHNDAHRNSSLRPKNMERSFCMS